MANIAASATYTITNWQESAFSEAQGAGKLTRASVRKQYKGDIDGEGVLEFVMAYNPDGSAVYTGFERVTGSVSGKTGSFVLRHEGTFQAGTARTKMEIVPDSGTDELRGMRGEGKEANSHGQEMNTSLDYWFE
ncbi:MAG: DUF3224 domain-containing protein [Planctomycetes bacterium]|nr:DUF3224 domain-containing protein [Planctomycetota bacterium]